MNENEEPSHELLEEATHALQRMSVPERPHDAEILALLSARQGDLVQTPRSPHPSPRRFRMNMMVSFIASISAVVIALVVVPLFLWNAWSPNPKPEPEPVPVAVTKAPGQERASLADPPAALHRAPQAERDLRVPPIRD